MIGDCGSQDSTIPYCISKSAKVVRVYDKSLSQIRNYLMDITETPWHMCLEPWETLFSGKEQIANWLTTGGPPVIRCQVLRNEVITKEVRIWQRSSGIRFHNPIFEYLPDKDAVPGECAVCRPPSS